MNRRPLRAVTSEDIARYQQDGVVCLRNIFDADWVRVLHQAAVAHVEKMRAIEKTQTPPRDQLPGTNFKHMWHDDPVIRSYVFESPVGEVTARVIQSRTIRLFFDMIFYKDPGAAGRPTPWHNDIGAWPVKGFMAPSTWMPLTPVNRASGLEFLAGSHITHRDIRYWNRTNNSAKMIRPADRPQFPDFEAKRNDPQVTFLSYDMEPGDVLILHPSVMHYSRGKTETAPRVAISTRWFGDDIVWDPRPECVNTRGISFDEMIAGERPGGKLFPLVWSTDGRRENDQVAS